MPTILKCWRVLLLSHTFHFSLLPSECPSQSQSRNPAIYSKRLVGASGLLIYAYMSYPLAELTSAFSLSLAGSQDAVEVDRRDAFAANVRAVAARMGVKNPERLSIRASVDSAGVALGESATIDRRGACMVLPAKLYDAFHASPALREKYPSIRTIDAINFVLAHESTHIAKNHALFSNTSLPLSLVLSNVAICLKGPHDIVPH
jgi:hypothetical protein